VVGGGHDKSYCILRACATGTGGCAFSGFSDAWCVGCFAVGAAFVSRYCAVSFSIFKFFNMSVDGPGC